MSGVAGGSRIKRSEVEPTVDNFIHNILNDYEYFQGGYSDVIISGSYQSDLSKMDFGDIDLIVNFTTQLDKRDLKKHFIDWLLINHKDDIRPFESQKYRGKYYSNTGELVSILYPIAQSNRAVQIDIIVSLDQEELNFKKEFLNLPAEKQGLVLGLIKVIMLNEANIPKVFRILGLPYKPLTNPNEEYDMILSSVCLTVEKITYQDRETYKTLNREILTKITNWNTILKILELEIKDVANMSFEQLLKEIKSKQWKNDRALKRIVGIFNSMISIKSGEVGTPKGQKKQEALNQINALISENHFNKYLSKVYITEESQDKDWYKKHGNELKEYIKKYKTDAASYVADATGTDIGDWENESEATILKMLLKGLSINKLNKIIKYKY